MNINFLKLLSCVLVSAGFAITPANAATIVYNAGAGQLNIDGDDNGTVSGDGWRTASFAKPGDIDGNNILGTDGWHVAYNNISNPGYAATTTFTSNRVISTNNGLMDNPNAAAGPTVADTIGTGIVFNSGGDDVFRIEITTNDLVGMTLRLGVLYDGGRIPNDVGTGTFALTQIAGSGSGTATTSTLSYDGLSLDVAFFDITGAVDGDVFVVSATEVSGTAIAPLWGVSFDTAVVPEPSTALLGGLGMLLLLRRRR